MSRDIIQRFLQNTINMDCRAAIKSKWCSGLFIFHDDACLFFNCGEIPLQGAFEPGFIEHDRMKRLGKRADVVEGALRDFADLTQIGAEWRILRQMFFRATEERADSR